jgi:hypothetical protein
MLDWLKGILEKLFKKEEDKDPEHEQDINTDNRDNLPDTPTPQLPQTDSETEKTSKKLWYPCRLIHEETKDLRMKTRGYYTHGFPMGAVVHFTAGRSRDRLKGGARNADTNLKQGLRSVKYACNSTPYCYFLIDADGNVHQNFPLDRWGYHAGKSSYAGLNDGVSNELVGIEVMCAGKLQYHKDQRCRAWFTDEKKGDRFFEKDEYSYWNENENIESGFYHNFTDKQKSALIDLILWMDSQSQQFNLNYVVGHDEVSPGRKSDPGGSLGMTMSNFREMLKDIKNAERKS